MTSTGKASRTAGDLSCDRLKPFAPTNTIALSVANGRTEGESACARHNPPMYLTHQYILYIYTVMSSYAELHCLSCYSFLRGASHPHELVERAATLGYAALAITDECSLAGVVKAHMAAKELGIKLIIGSELNLEEGIRLVALAPGRAAYSELSGLISMARRRSPKGEYRATLRDVIFHLKRCLLIWLPERDDAANRAWGLQLQRLCKQEVASCGTA